MRQPRHLALDISFAVVDRLDTPALRLAALNIGVDGKPINSRRAGGRRDGRIRVQYVDARDLITPPEAGVLGHGHGKPFPVLAGPARNQAAQYCLQTN